MYSDWDPAKARRAYLIEFAVAWLTAIVMAAVPVCLAMKAGAL
ncbi:hypothetical protein PMI07_006342 [Rhizobium sp. CF080]|nr:hypothetical protein PMI07_006342 [Rhizobium sp. CF080]